MDSLFDQSALTSLAERLVAAARKAGADAADAVAVRSVSLGVQVRDDEVEESERAEGNDMGLRVLVGRRQAVVSTNDIFGESVTALAERAQLTRRTCERWFTKVGLPSPRVVMVLTRLLYAHRLLLDPGYTVEDVALKLGYSKPKTLQMHLRAVFGLTAGELRVSVSVEEALAAVTQRYFTPFGQVAS